MENNTRIALIGIIVEKEESAEPLNHLLHEYRECVVGRMDSLPRQGSEYYQRCGGCATGHHQCIVW